MRAYERAKAKAQKAIERFDNFSYLWRELRAALELFDGEGRLKPSAAREVENINSALRQFLATSRGQVTQEMLELFAYVHNHRRFVRGKRAGQAPLEILTGTKLEKTWLESLLELEPA
jgi:hypothetical protein